MRLPRRPVLTRGDEKIDNDAAKERESLQNNMTRWDDIFPWLADTRHEPALSDAASSRIQLSGPPDENLRTLLEHIRTRLLNRTFAEIFPYASESVSINLLRGSGTGPDRTQVTERKAANAWSPGRALRSDEGANPADRRKSTSRVAS